jgi:hypothetical protein
MNRKVISEISRVKELMGVVNENIESVLKGGKVLRRGSKGPDVEKLQKLLIEMGYDLGDFGPNKDGVDGSFGPTVDKIIREFQGKNDLKVDGKVGKDTLSKMISVGQSTIPNFTSVLDSIGISIDTVKDLLSGIGSLFGGTEPDKTKDHFVFYFSFPGYEPRYDGSGGWFEEALDWVRAHTPEAMQSFLGKEGTYGSMGHAGVALINSTGTIDIYEFGRYSGAKKGMGIKKHSRTKGAKIQDGKIINLEQVCSLVKNNAQGHAKDYKMEGVAVPITKEGYGKGMEYAKSVTSKGYEIFDFDSADDDANCATFGLEVVRAATGSGREYCLPNPGAGLKVVQMFRGSMSTSC